VLRLALVAALAVAATSAVLVAGSRTGRALPGVTAVPEPAASASPAPAREPDALLYRTFQEIGGGRLDVALAEIDRVIEAYPHFRLAHLIKGDLLLARARPITTLGDTHHAPKERLDELREEALARLMRHRHERPRDRVPRYLVQLAPEQKHALVVDTSKHTLYVFENAGGVPRYVTDYYVTIGKNGIDKFVQGDKKTPLGVYHVTASLPRERLLAMYGKLSELYGSGALPINYPNEWDRRQGRNGYGIWLHGVPFDTYSRPPRASDGCVALTNEDFEAVAQRVQAGITPVIIAAGVEWVAPEAVQALREELARAIEAWRRDWESLDTARYLSHYAADFSAGGFDLARWSQHKYKVNAAKQWIKVRLGRVSIFLYPGREDLALVSFEQDYTSSNLSDLTRKRQYWKREGGRWQILYEGRASVAPIEAPLRSG
jgi:murein L,D-transpeptidase YafK